MQKAFHLLLLLATVATSLPTNAQIKHFIFFSRDREKIHEASFWSNPGVVGAQVTYSWKMLEPVKDQYDFSTIEADLKFLQSKGKKLFTQIQDVTFDTTYNAVPRYLTTDPAYHGGVNPQYAFSEGEAGTQKAGWVSRRWDPAVADRFHRLLLALGKQFDGRIEGINLPESSIDVGTTGKYYPTGFTLEKYRDALEQNMQTVKTAFPHSTTIQYANFFPGPDGPYLKELYAYAKTIGIGMGGPDIKVDRKAQMDNSYPLIRGLHGSCITGVAVQDGNYDIVNVKTGARVTVPEILAFATDYLRLDYIFWCTEEPYYSKKVLPMLAAKK